MGTKGDVPRTSSSTHERLKIVTMMPHTTPSPPADSVSKRRSGKRAFTRYRAADTESAAVALVPKGLSHPFPYRSKTTEHEHTLPMPAPTMNCPFDT